MDDYYLCSRVFIFLLKRKNNKTENSVNIYATLVKNYRKVDFSHKSKENLPLFTCVFEFLSAFYNIKKDQLPQTLELEEIELRKKCLLLFYEINYNINFDLEDFADFVESTFNRKRQETDEEVKFNIKERTKRLYS